MIKLNLQMFAKTLSQTYHYREIKHVQKESMPGKPAKRDNSFLEGRVTEFSGKKTYIMYEVNDADDKNEKPFKRATGSALRDLESHDKIKLNKRKRVWVSKSNKMYVIREMKGGR